MAESRRSEVLAGAFVLVALAAGVGVLVWLGAVRPLTSYGQRVVFFAPQGAGNLGVLPGSPVTVNDAPVGKIEEIRLDHGGRRTLYVTRLLRKDISVRQDARADVVVSFIGGASVVIRDYGTPAAPLADAEHPVALTEGPNALFRQAREALGYGPLQRSQFQQTIAAVADAAGRLREITTAVAAETDTGDSGALLAKIKAVAEGLVATAANLQVTSARLKAETERANPAALLAKVHASADDVRKVAADAAGMMETIRPGVEQTVAAVAGYAKKDIAELLAGFGKVNAELLETVAELKTLSASAKDIVVLNRPQIDATISHLKSVAANLDAAAREIRRNPWRLLRRPVDKDERTQNIYDAVRAFAEGAGQLHDALTRLEALRESRPAGVKAGDPELAKTLKHLQTTFEKFRQVEDALWKELTD